MKTILCFGDSNTHGHMAENGGRFAYEIRWPGALAARLGAEFHIIEEGLSGRTTTFDDPLHEGMNALPVVLPIMLSHEPLDTMIVMLGTNDTKERFGCSAAALGVCMQRLVQKILCTPAWRAKPDVILVAPAPMEAAYATLPGGVAMGRGCCEKSLALADVYKGVAESCGCRFFNAGEVATVHPADFVHITAESHARLAAALAEMLVCEKGMV